MFKKSLFFLFFFFFLLLQVKERDNSEICENFIITIILRINLRCNYNAMLQLTQIMLLFDIIKFLVKKRIFENLLSNQKEK